MVMAMLGAGTHMVLATAQMDTLMDMVVMVALILGVEWILLWSAICQPTWTGQD